VSWAMIQSEVCHLLFSAAINMTKNPPSVLWDSGIYINIYLYMSIGKQHSGKLIEKL